MSESALNSFLSTFPPTAEVPAALKDDAQYKLHSSLLDKVINPHFKALKEVQEKLAARKKIVLKLQQHLADGTFPPEIPTIRKPQMPESRREDFNKAVEETMNRARLEILKHSIRFRRLDQADISTESNSVITKINDEINGYEKEVLVAPGINSAVLINAYKCHISFRMKNLVDKIDTNLKMELYLDKKRREEQAESNLRMEVEDQGESSNPQLTELQKQVKAMEKSISTLNKKVKNGPSQPPPTKKKKPQAPKANGKNRKPPTPTGKATGKKPAATKKKGNGAGAERAARPK